MDHVIEDGRDLHAPRDAWERLASVLKSWMRREGVSIAQLHRSSNLDRKTLSRLRDAESTSYWRASLETLERALGWRQGAVRAVLEADDLDVDDQAAIDQLVLPTGRARDLDQDARDRAAEARAQGLTRDARYQQVDDLFDGMTQDEKEEYLLRLTRKVLEERRAAEAERRGQ
jgi:hypothetical protein